MDFLGVFLGVVAGTAVNIATTWFLAYRSETQQVRNLNFELKLNLRKIDRWLEEITAWRNAVNGDSLNNYFGYFDFSRFITVTANNMFQSGRLYKYLSEDQIGDLQVIASELSPYGEQYINNIVRQGKLLFDQSHGAGAPAQWHGLHKQRVVQDVNFWETKLKKHRAAIDTIAGSLK